MKYIHTFLVLSVNVLLFSSCQDKMKADSNSTDSVSFAASFTGSTKASETDYDKLVHDGFNVLGKVNGTTSSLHDFTDVANYDINDFWFIPSSPRPYPTDGSLMDFYASYPSQFTSYGTTARIYDYNVSFGTSSDLVAAVQTCVPKHEAPVPLTFYHLLSAFTIYARPEDDEEQCTIEEIKVQYNHTALYEMPTGTITSPLDGFWSHIEQDKKSYTDIQLPVDIINYSEVFPEMMPIPGEIIINVIWNYGDQSFSASRNYTLPIGTKTDIFLTLRNRDIITFTATIREWNDSQINFDY